MIRLLAATLLLLSALPALADRVVVMRGRWNPAERTNTFQYVGDERSLVQATLAGVNGQEVVDRNRANLTREVDLYMAAQKAAGVEPPKPLYVLLDADENWVYAHWGSSFVLKHPDGREERVAEGFVQLGEKADYVQQQHQQALARESNQALLALVNQHYQTHFTTRDPNALVSALFRGAPCVRSLPVSNEPWLAYTSRLRGIYERQGCDVAKFDAALGEFEKANPGKSESFETVINRRFQFSVEGQTDRTLSVYTDHLEHPRFVERLRELVTADLTARGVADPGFLFVTPEAQDITRRFGKLAAINGLNAALTHEIGHLIHYRAGTGLGFGPVRTGIPGAPSSHSATTLSNPQFALVEGFAEAAAYRFSEPPTAQDVRRATRIDYDSSVGALQKFVNDALLQRVGAALRAKNLLPAGQPISIEGGPMGRTTPARGPFPPPPRPTTPTCVRARLAARWLPSGRGAAGRIRCRSSCGWRA